jgi:cytochrome c oxidase subunit 2
LDVDTSFKLVPSEASQGAAQVDHLVLFELAVTVFFVTSIFAAITWFALRYRRRIPIERPPYIGGNLALELTWTFIPLVIVAVMFVWGAKVFIDARTPPEGAMEIYVIGKQWMWKVQHPEGRREINALHVPLGKAVKLVLTSQDVIHDFSIPDFRMKQDVLPGMYSTEWFVPSQIGEYHLFCDQYCGAKHAEMTGAVTVMLPGDYEKWLAGDPTSVPPASAGKKLFTVYGCNTCHGQFGPTLAGLYGRPVDVVDDHGKRRRVIADEAYLRESILYPEVKLVVGYPNRMPSFKSTLGEEQILDLIEYIKSLSGAADVAPYFGPPTGPATQPGDAEPKIGNPPFANYRTNQ